MRLGLRTRFGQAAVGRGDCRTAGSAPVSNSFGGRTATDQSDHPRLWLVSGEALDELVHGLELDVLPGTASWFAEALTTLGWPTELCPPAEQCAPPIWAAEMTREMRLVLDECPLDWRAVQQFSVSPSTAPLDAWWRIASWYEERRSDQPFLESRSQERP